MIVEDAHVNVDGVAEHLHQFMQSGDYFIFDDTNPIGPAEGGKVLHVVYRLWAQNLNLIASMPEQRIWTGFC